MPKEIIIQSKECTEDLNTCKKLYHIKIWSNLRAAVRKNEPIMSRAECIPVWCTSCRGEPRLSGNRRQRVATLRLKTKRFHKLVCGQLKEELSVIINKSKLFMITLYGLGSLWNSVVFFTLQLQVQIKTQVSRPTPTKVQDPTKPTQVDCKMASGRDVMLRCLKVEAYFSKSVKCLFFILFDLFSNLCFKPSYLQITILELCCNSVCM